MSFRPGDHVGPYEILAPIGAGGMGEVYKARDSRLDRLVAIKTSKSQFNERFTREARTVAALNHPNIATLFDVGPDYLVMEFVEGESLRGPLSGNEAVSVAKQIVDAIEAAHEKGIVHRDLKPGNILRREDGSIKVLDFGLAKALDDESGVSQAPGADSPTLTLEATRAGMILGTAAYMSPEQAKGKRADRRADIFSFGVVLYELLTGERLFDGESTGEILASVIKENPSLDKVPAEWRGLIERCIEKDPRQRLQAIGEARILLERGLPTAQVAVASAPSSSRFSFGTVIAAGVAVLALAGAGWMYSRPASEQPKHIIRFDVDSKGAQPTLALSPDGQTLVWVSEQKLWRRRMDSQEIEAIPGAEGALFPFWSPDSKNIAFFQQGSLKRMSASGGPPITLAPAIQGRGGSWNQDNIIIFAPGPSTGIFQVPASGGTPQIVLRPTGDERVRFPFFLPDGKHFLVNRQASNLSGILVASLNDGSVIPLRSEDSTAIYSSGFLLFAIDTTLMAQPFDARALKFTGDAFPVSDSLGSNTFTSYACVTASFDGTLIYSSSNATATQLRWYDRKGVALDTLGEATNGIRQLAISPDGKQIAQALGPQSHERLYLQSASGGPASQLGGGQELVRTPVWSPDSRTIAFPKLGRLSDLFLWHLDGSAQEEPLNVRGLNLLPSAWSRDGKWLAYRQDTPEAGPDIMLLPLSGDRKPVVFLKTPAAEYSARFSPDGHWLVFEQIDQSQSAVYVQAISPEGHATGVKYRISSGIGRDPRWRADGKEILYLSGTKVMTVPVNATATSFEAGPAVELFDGPSGVNGFDVTADHQRILFGVPDGERRQTQALNIILNWTELAKK